MTYTTVIGNVTDDPELRFTPSGKPVANFTVAENRSRFNRDRQEWEQIGTSYYRCAVWDQAAENVAESIQKGLRVIVHGEVYQETYERRDNSGTGMSVQMAVQEVGPALRFATARVTRNERQGGGQQQPQHARQQPQQPRQAASQHDPWAAPAGREAPPFRGPEDEPPF